MKAIFTICIICCLPFLKLSAQEIQNSWIKTSSVNEKTLPVSQKSVLNKIKEMKGYENPVLIEVKSIAKSIAGDGSLSFGLPGVNQSLKARSINVDAESEETYEWMGQFEDDMGNMTVVSDQGKIRAHISYDGEAYEIFHVNNDTHVLMKVSESRSPEQICGTDHSETLNKPKAIAPISSNARIVPCLETIRVLALTTPDARAADPSLNQTIQLAISQFNQARANSLISSQANIILARTRDTNIDESANTVAELDNLINDPTIAAWRGDDNADLVLLFTNGDYPDAIGRAGTLTLDPERAYAVVEIPEATTLYTATHEIGHLFGARHQRCAVFLNNGCDDTQGFNHGYRYSYGAAWWLKRRTTMMHQNRYQHTRVLNFSNPNTSDHGTTMGTTTHENNARWIGEHANQVSQYRLGGTLTAYIEGPAEVYYNNPYGTWEAVVSCGDAPYSYQWQTSYDGFNYGSVQGTGSTFGYYSFQNFYLRLTVTSDDGQQRIYTKFIYFNGGGYRLATESQDDPNLLSDQSNEVLISLGDAYPNPTLNRVYIPFAVNIKQPVRIELLDVNGKNVLTLTDNEYEKGFHEISINTSKLKSGLYMYKMVSNDFSSTKKIIIDK